MTPHCIDGLCPLPNPPGLMMALDRGGQCRGMVFRIPSDQAEATLHTLFRRELVVNPPGTPPRWLAAVTDAGPLRALGFVVDRRSPFYSSGLMPEQVANVAARAAGHWGSCAEYLHNTVSRLEALGIHDRNLWRLQALVAERITSSVRPTRLSGTSPEQAATDEPRPPG